MLTRPAAMTLALFTLLTACSSAPSLSHVAPNHVVAGDPIHVWGSKLNRPLRVEFVGAQGRAVAIDAIGFRGGSHIALSVPQDLPPGLWSVRVQADDLSLRLTDVLTVDEESSLSVCASGVVSNTRVSLVGQTARIERFRESHGEEVVALELANVRRVELDVPESEEPCSVVWLRLNDGRRELFDQSTTRPMRARAARLAQDIGKPLVSLQGADVGSSADAD
ncbi:MAG: hypothetical protein ACJAV2_001909 [Myxococcota bacterium]|jgi:hypothetical protein